LSNEGGIKKVKVYFNEAAKYILNDESTNIFTLTDNKQVYLYSYGVYKNEDTEAYLDTRIRDTHNKLFMEKWEEKNPKFPLPDLFPEASSGFVAETLAYIRAYTYELRKRIDGQAARYINLQNGLFDLEKWEKIDHTPDYLSISQIPVKYDTEAKCPQIKKFLREVANPKDIPFILEWFGYCLTTDVRYQKALMLYGIPGTGKSVLLSLLEMFIGTDNCSAESLQKIEEDKYRSANLYGKRLNVCNDIPSTKMHKTEVFKKLVSGLDTIDAEVKYQQPFKFRNIAKLAFSANKLPEGPKDPAFFERFVLIEFQNKFRGTDKDDKMLIHKLTTENELSGLLNLALKGLKRLYKKDKFSYKKTFEETEREYIINSNPVLFFMQECTVVSDKDIDATMLYIAYVDWSNKNKKPFVSKIEFSRRLNQIGYTSHRENLVKDGSKKATYWDNVQIKQIDENYKLDEKNNKDVRKNEGKSVFGQDLGQDRTSRSCPVFSSQVIAKSHSENAFGQDPFPFVVFEEKNEQNKCDNLEEVKQENNENEKSSANMSKRSCPCVCFFDSGEYGQDLESNMSEILSDDPNECLIDFSLGSDYPKNVEDFEILRRDLKNFARSHCNYVVESVPVFVGEFNSKYPGHKQRLGLQAVLSNAERLKERGWR
jgi:putative DNA primase/helicase